MLWICCRFTLHLFPSSQPHKPMSYSQHWKVLVAIFGKCGAITSKTYVPRKSYDQVHCKAVGAVL
jgi:hypothetical protein